VLGNLETTFCRTGDLKPLTPGDLENAGDLQGPRRVSRLGDLEKEIGDPGNLETTFRRVG